MKQRTELYSRVFSNKPDFMYLPDSDRYFLKQLKPEMKFNVIGTGNNGQEHIRVTLFEGRATIKGIYDPNPGSIAGAKIEFSKYVKDRELLVYSSLEKACNDPEIDGLIISTPNFSHIDVIRKVIKSGKHILLEKPMATNVKDAYEIMNIAKSYPAVFQIGLQYRYKSIYTETIHEIFTRRSLGDIKTISIAEHRIPFLDKVKQWNKFSEFSGGTLVEKCCHYFDLFNLFAQSKPIRVFASGSMAVNFKDFSYDDRKSDILDNAFVIVEYENDIRAVFNLCMFSPLFYEELVLCGADGRLRAYEQDDLLAEGRIESSVEIFRGEMFPTRKTRTQYPHAIEKLGHNGATFFEHINFINNILGEKTNTATVEDGFWSVIVGIAAEESIKTRTPVLINDLLQNNNISI